MMEPVDEKRELTNDELEKIDGGSQVTRCSNQTVPYKYTHYKCGGEIAYKFFGYCKCKKCGEKHWMLDDFEYQCRQWYDR